MPIKQSALFSFDEMQPDESVNSPAPAIPAAELTAEITEIDFISVPETITATAIKKSTRGRKKLTESAFAEELINVPEDEILFQKKYYSIGLVAEMFRVNISLIRFWENEFDILKPKKNGKGDRHFRPEDIVNLKLIHHLLREKKYTIEGARDFLKKNKKSDEAFGVIEELKRMKLFLLDLKMSL